MPFLKAEDIIPAEMRQDPVLTGLESDQHFLQCILRGTEGGNELEMVSSQANPCCKEGDNYMSCMTRVEILGQNKLGETFTRSVLMKRQPANVGRRQAFRCDPAFRNETHGYMTIVPIMREFANAPMPFPECLHASSQLIVLQDLQPLGFKMADRTKGLDIAHTELAIKAAAKFHGTSLAMKHLEKEKFDGIRGLTTELAFAPESEPVFGASVENALKRALAALERLEGSWATSWDLGDSVHKLRSLQGSVFRRLRAMSQPSEPLAVMCHGDMWVNNMLFRYEENEPVEVKFVDLQVLRYSSLATDLLYLFTTSMDPAVLRYHQDDLLVLYHKELVRTIEEIAPGAPLVTLQQINDQIEELALFGLLMGFLLLPALTRDDENEINLDNYFKDGDSIEKSMGNLGSDDTLAINENYRERVRSLVLHYVDRGYI